MNEELQSQVAQLQKQIKEKDKQNQELLKKLEKYEKSRKSGSGKKSLKRTSSSSSSDNQGDNENLKILSRMNKNSLIVSQSLRMSLKEFEQRRSLREETNKKEEIVTNIKKECLRKYFDKKWNTFEEIDLIKKNETTILLNKLQEKIDSKTTSYLTLCEVNLWESEAKYKTAKDLMDCYQNSIEEILILESVVQRN